MPLAILAGCSFLSALTCTCHSLWMRGMYIICAPNSPTGIQDLSAIDLREVLQNLRKGSAGQCVALSGADPCMPKRSLEAAGLLVMQVMV